MNWHDRLEELVLAYIRKGKKIDLPPRVWVSIVDSLGAAEKLALAVEEPGRNAYYTDARKELKKRLTMLKTEMGLLDGSGC